MIGLEAEKESSSAKEVMREMKKSKTAVKSTPGTKVGAQKGYSYFFWILPFLVLVFLFSYFPLHGWIYAFYDYKPPRSLSDCQFVGLQ